MTWSLAASSAQMLPSRTKYGWTRPLDRLDDLGVRLVHEVAHLAADRLLPVREPVDVGVDARDPWRTACDSPWHRERSAAPFTVSWKPSSICSSRVCSYSSTQASPPPARHVAADQQGGGDPGAVHARAGPGVLVHDPSRRRVPSPARRPAHVVRLGPRPEEPPLRWQPAYRCQRPLCRRSSSSKRASRIVPEPFVLLEVEADREAGDAVPRWGRRRRARRREARTPARPVPPRWDRGSHGRTAVVERPPAFVPLAVRRLDLARPSTAAAVGPDDERGAAPGPRPTGRRRPRGRPARSDPVTHRFVQTVTPASRAPSSNVASNGSRRTDMQ